MKNAFTLIEVIIAIFILAVGITAVLAMFPLGIQIVSSSKMATTAVYLGEAKMEEIISTSYEEISGEQQTLNPPFSAYSRETEVTCFDPNGSSSPNCPEDTGIKKIKVIVSWGVPAKKIELVTLITKR
ncbi:prepilin-type N-terminal cleavage/methylation domain-containing protein [Patescibacteria group bacterium]|nr:prepilin-type N-terminal cleavage/methylation domain-containing protein [Patescibacteria group bacterium]